MVSTHSRPKAAGRCIGGAFTCLPVSTHSRPKAAGPKGQWLILLIDRVSTHSRPKAAGERYETAVIDFDGFNTQPPEGGWGCAYALFLGLLRFNTQPPEGGWLNLNPHHYLYYLFQHTAARRRLGMVRLWRIGGAMFQHTAARRRLGRRMDGIGNSRCRFNTQPPEGGWQKAISCRWPILKFQHTAARRRLDSWAIRCIKVIKFQHTAARRRLVANNQARFWIDNVSTHSRPKAAGASLKSLAPSGFAAPISLGSQEKRERKYNTAFSVTPAFAIS